MPEAAVHQVASEHIPEGAHQGQLQQAESALAPPSPELEIGGRASDVSDDSQYISFHAVIPDFSPCPSSIVTGDSGHGPAPAMLPQASGGSRYSSSLSAALYSSLVAVRPDDLRFSSEPSGASITSSSSRVASLQRVARRTDTYGPRASRIASRGHRFAQHSIGPSAYQAELRAVRAKALAESTGQSPCTPQEPTCPELCPEAVVIGISSS